MNFVETSAKSGSNVGDIFEMLVHNILNQIDSEVVDVFTHPGVKLGTLKYKDIKPERTELPLQKKPPVTRICC